MPLKRVRITASRINSGYKAEKVLSIADELNLCPVSFVYGDDSDFEWGWYRFAARGELPSRPPFRQWVLRADFGLFSFSEASGLNDRAVRQQKRAGKIPALRLLIEEYND